jgi:hypothetical protein
MPRHARSSRRRRTWSIARPLVFFAAAGLIATWEAVRIADARATVVSGWTAGIALGAGSGLVLATLAAVTTFVQRQPQWSRRDRPQAVLALIVILTPLLLLVVALLSSTSPRRYGSHPAPDVITSGIEVAEIAYAGTFSAVFAVAIIAWLAAEVRKHRPPLAPEYPPRRDRDRAPGSR